MGCMDINLGGVVYCALASVFGRPKKVIAVCDLIEEKFSRATHVYERGLRSSAVFLPPCNPDNDIDDLIERREENSITAPAAFMLGITVQGEEDFLPLLHPVLPGGP